MSARTKQRPERSGIGKPTTKAAKSDKSKPVVPANKMRHLEVVLAKGKTADRAMADLVTAGLVSNASTAVKFVYDDQGEVSLTDLVASLQEQGEAANRGDLAGPERMLAAQTVALNAVFAELSRVARINMFTAPEHAERYLRLALKAQSQTRATVETLAAIKNPSVVFARQANINNGGQQQVNNGVAPDAASCARESELQPNKLLEGNDGERMDTGAQSAAGGANQDLATVGAVNRAEDEGG